MCKDAVVYLGDAASNDLILVNKELERMWEEAALPCFNELSLHTP
jgi:hypothetical protein